MNKIDLGQTITILANLGVIVGIGFLAFEMRQNTQAIRLTASQEMASEVANFNLNWLPPEIAAINTKVVSGDFSSISDVERSQLTVLDQAFLLLHQNLFYQYQSGSLDPVVWSGRHRTLVRNFGLRNFQEHWEAYSETFNDDFREYIDTVVLPEAQVRSE